MLLSQLLLRLKSDSGIKRLENTVGGELFSADVEIERICPDHRRIKSGDLFVAIKGLRADGHDHVKEAVERGAAALLLSSYRARELSGQDFLKGMPILISNDTAEGAAYLFSAYYGNPQDKLTVVGVTGTNGKTTVSNMIAHILMSAGESCGVIGTLGSFSRGKKLEIISLDPNASMTTPDPEQLYAIIGKIAEDGCKYLIMEVSSHSLVQGRVAPIDFEIGIFTNLTEDHLDLHQNMENYFLAKAGLFDKCKIAVINCDDAYGRRLSELYDGKIARKTCSFGLHPSDHTAEDIHLSEEGIEYKLISPNLRLRIRSPLYGEYNVMNTMQAVAAAGVLGVKATRIKDALRAYAGTCGRLERLKIPYNVGFSVYIDYAHTPDALSNLLRCVKGFMKRGQRLVLLFGCGGDRDRAKRPLMGRIATEMADHTIITSDNSRSEIASDIIKDIISGVDPDGSYTVIVDRRSAIEYAVSNARDGDILILAGKGHESYEIDAEGKKPFSERDIVMECCERCFGRKS